MFDESEIESYKSRRIDQHEVRDITLRHDLHALSVFFFLCGQTTLDPRESVTECRNPFRQGSGTDAYSFGRGGRNNGRHQKSKRRSTWSSEYYRRHLKAAADQEHNEV
jgi:hypothetical protein